MSTPAVAIVAVGALLALAMVCLTIMFVTYTKRTMPADEDRDVDAR